MFLGSDYKGNISFSFLFPGLLYDVGSLPNRAYVVYDYQNSDFIFTVSRVRFEPVGSGTYSAYFDVHVQGVNTLNLTHNNPEVAFFIFSVSWEGSSPTTSLTLSNVYSVSTLPNLPERSFLRFTLSILPISLSLVSSLVDAERTYEGKAIFGIDRWRFKFTTSYTVSTPPTSISHNLLRLLFRTNLLGSAQKILYTFPQTSSYFSSLSIVEYSSVSTTSLPGLSFLETLSVTNSFGRVSITTSKIYSPAAYGSVSSYPFPLVAPSISFVTSSNGLKYDTKLTFDLPVTFGVIKDVSLFTYSDLALDSYFSGFERTTPIFYPFSNSNYAGTVSFRINTVSVATFFSFSSLSFNAIFNFAGPSTTIPVSVSFPGILYTASAVVTFGSSNISFSAGQVYFEAGSLINDGTIPLIFRGVTITPADGVVFFVSEELFDGAIIPVGATKLFDLVLSSTDPLTQSYTISFNTAYDLNSYYNNKLVDTFSNVLNINVTVSGAPTSSFVELSTSVWSSDNPPVVMVGKLVTGSISIQSLTTSNTVAHLTLSSFDPNVYFTTNSNVGILGVNPLLIDLAPGETKQVYTQWYMSDSYTSSIPSTSITISSNADVINGINTSVVYYSHSLSNSPLYSDWKIGTFSVNGSTNVVILNPGGFVTLSDVSNDYILRRTSINQWDFYENTDSDEIRYTSQYNFGFKANILSSDPARLPSFYNYSTVSYADFGVTYSKTITTNLAGSTPSLSYYGNASVPFDFVGDALAYTVIFIHALRVSHINGVSIANSTTGYDGRITISLYLSHLLKPT